MLSLAVGDVKALISVGSGLKLHKLPAYRAW
jgi:hypothetical protein